MANQKYGLIRRSCHFVNDVQRRKMLYLTLVRSQFEHCSQIWCPTNNKTQIGTFENIQKKCTKLILFEEELSYSFWDVYIRKCKQIGILPLGQRFILNDMMLFHKIVNHFLPIRLPCYLSLFSGNTRLRSSHLERLCFVSSVVPRGQHIQLE